MYVNTYTGYRNSAPCRYSHHDSQHKGYVWCVCCNTLLQHAAATHYCKTPLQHSRVHYTRATDTGWRRPIGCLILWCNTLLHRTTIHYRNRNGWHSHDALQHTYTHTHTRNNAASPRTRTQSHNLHATTHKKGNIHTNIRLYIYVYVRVRVCVYTHILV